MRRIIVSSALAAGCLLMPSLAGASTSISLQLPTSLSSSLLGNHCSTVHQQDFASSISPDGDSILGEVYLQSQCLRQGHLKTYALWVATQWSYVGVVEATVPMLAAPLNLNHSSAFRDGSGNVIRDSFVGNRQKCTESQTIACHYRASVTWSALARPLGVHVEQDGDSMIATWDQPDPAVGTNIVTITSGGKIHKIATPTNSVVISGLSPSTKYTISVLSLPLGQRTSDDGGAAISDPVEFTSESATTVPTPPSFVAGEFIHNDQAVHIWWNGAGEGNSPSDLNQVRIYSSQSASTAVALLTTTRHSITQAIKASQTKLWVCIRTHNGAGWSQWSQRHVVIVGAYHDD